MGEAHTRKIDGDYVKCWRTGIRVYGSTESMKRFLSPFDVEPSLVTFHCRTRKELVYSCGWRLNIGTPRLHNLALI